MKCTLKALKSMAIFLGTTSTAFAATGTYRDNSGIFVWIFLGFCALIVVAQLIPAMLVLFGAVKGLKKKDQAVPETVLK